MWIAAALCWVVVLLATKIGANTAPRPPKKVREAIERNRWHP